MYNDLIERSFKYCEKITKSHYENFPVASRLIPKDKRKYIYSIYAFARKADDFADEPGMIKEERLRCLDEWHNKLSKCYENNSNENEPIFIALGQTVKDFLIPIELLDNLLKAFRQDVVKNRYDTFEEVLSYCRNSANPIGRLVLMILNYRDEKLFKYSDYICTALQLTNFWQDVAVDLKKDRVYIPHEDMRKFGYTIGELFESRFNDNFRELIQFEIEKTEGLFQRGKNLISLVNFAKELKLIWLGGMEILNKIKKNKYNVFTKRPELGIFDKIKLFFR